MTSMNKNLARKKRSNRKRSKISGTAERPRFCVYRSLNYIYAQLVDDSKGKTLVSFDSRRLKGKDSKNDLKAGEKVGSEIAKIALAKKIENVVFDRQGNKYHGKIKALAEGARKEGLKF